MKRNRIVRAWTDEVYRSTLSAVERQSLPDHPAGAVELSSEELTQVSGGHSANWYDGCRSNMSCSRLFSDCGGGGGSYEY